MKSSFLIFSALALLPFSAHAEAENFACERFQSNCVGNACVQLITPLMRDTERKIFTVRKTETVDYKIDGSGVTEKLRGEQAVFSKDRQLTVQYKFIGTENGRKIFFNKDKKGNINTKVEIDPATGFYLNFLIHTDGSITEVPLGEPYLAYFGWCEVDALPPIAAPADAPAAALPESSAPAPTPAPAPAPLAAPVAPQ